MARRIAVETRNLTAAMHYCVYKVKIGSLLLPDVVACEVVAVEHSGNSDEATQ